MKTEPNDSINALLFADGTGFAGLTKREYFSAMFTSSSMSSYKGNDITIEDHVYNGIKAADELIKELNKNNKV